MNALFSFFRTPRIAPAIQRTQRKQRIQGCSPVCSVEPLEDRLLMSTYQVSNLLDAGPGSLRQAILSANNHAGADVITFAKNVVGTIKLTSGQLTVTDSVQIQGPGANVVAVSGNGQSRVLQVTKSGINVSVSGLTLTQGNAGFAFGGALVNRGNLALSNDIVSNNVAASFDTGPFSGGGGGAVMNSGALFVNNCTFDSNHVYAHDPNLLDGGGAIYNAGILTVTHSTLSHNTGQLSPSVKPVGDPDTYVANGGAVFNAGIAVLTDTTVAANSVDGEAGAIFNAAAGNLTLVNDTIAGNHGVYSGGLDGNPAGKIKIGNTILATNTDAGGAFLFESDLATDVTSLGHNLVGISTGSQLVASDKFGNPFNPLDPKLGPLAFNGGPTKTLAINPFASPAYNAGSNTLAAQFGLTTDQRGDARVSNGTVDIGAFESLKLNIVPIVL